MTRSACLALVAMALAGCVAVENENLELTLASGELSPIVPQRPWTMGDGPSATTLDRSGWEPTQVHVAIDSSYHSPTYAPARTLVKTEPRHVGEYPTVDSALSAPPNNRAQAVEAAKLPFYTLADAVMIIPRMFMQAPWKPVQSPSLSFERTPSAAP